SNSSSRQLIRVPARSVAVNRISPSSGGPTNVLTVGVTPGAPDSNARSTRTPLCGTSTLSSGSIAAPPRTRRGTVRVTGTVTSDGPGSGGSGGGGENKKDAVQRAVIIVVVVSFGDDTSAALGDDKPRGVSASRVAPTVRREKRIRTPDPRPQRLLARLAPSAGHGKVPVADRTKRCYSLPFPRDS